MSFDRLAPWYQILEYLGMGRALQRRREEFLPDLAEKPAPRQILLLGDGDGRFLAALLAVNPSAEVDTVDGSRQMLCLARRRAQDLLRQRFDAMRIRFHHADALTWVPTRGGRYDAVVTHFFLDCLSEPQIDLLLARLRPVLAPEAVWIVSEFNQPARGFPAWRSRLWIAGLYRLFAWVAGLRVQRLPDHRSCLERNGLTLEKEVVVHGGLLVSQRWRHASGAGFSV